MDPFEQARQCFLRALEHHNHHRYPEAEAHYRQAHALMPDRVSVLVNLAAVLVQQQRPGEAWEFCRRALELEPGHADAAALRVLCEPAHSPDARTGASAPADEPDALVVQASLKAAGGDHAAAMGLYRRVLALEATHAAAGEGFFRSVLVTGAVPGGDAPDFDALLARALQAPWMRPQLLAPLALRRLAEDAALSALARRCADAWPQPVVAPAELDAVACNTVLAALMNVAIVADRPLECLLANLRRWWLHDAVDAAAGRPAHGGQDAPDPVVAAHCALAMQCELNDGLYPVSDSESDALARLEQQINRTLARGEMPPVRALVGLACYRPLHARPDAARLLHHPWPAPVAALLDEVIGQRLAMAAAREAVPQIGTIADATSLKVRAQYEASPFPKWRHVARPDRALGLPEYAAAHLGPEGLAWAPAVQRPRVLIAGCGTGQQALETALRLRQSDILAVDLSRASLGHAVVRARQAGAHHVRFAQADVLELTHEHPFDLIECTGVLHHLERPIDGLTALARLLAPQGLMRLALYSARGRRDVTAARELIARQRYLPSPVGIRACREHLLALPDSHPAHGVRRFSDFYALNECRDLLFHVREHQYTLPEVGALLDGAGLELAGFEYNAARWRLLGSIAPHADPHRDLAAWDAVESRHPDVFSGMYGFWVRHAAPQAPMG